MATRVSIVFVVLVGVAFVTGPQATAITLQSQRRNVSVVATPPTGWTGPAYKAWPSYDTFSFSRGPETSACYLEVRFDPYTDEPGDRHSADDIVIHWNTTSLADIRAQFKREFQNPRVERIASLQIAGQPMRVYAVYDADGYYYAAEVLHNGTVISFELRCESRRVLQQHRRAFVSFLRSVRVA